MFSFDYKVIKSIGGDIVIKNEYITSVDKEIISVLNQFEQKVYEALLEYLSRKKSFKYVQSSISANAIFTNSCMNLDSKNFGIFLVSQHPNYIGSILINDILSSQFENKKVYVVYFKNEFGSIWLNSKARPENLISHIKSLNKYCDLKSSLEVNLIEIYGSQLIEFRQNNPGYKSSEWTLKIK